MEFDRCLDCPMNVINDYWPDLGAREENGALVVCVRGPAPLWRRSER